MDYFCAWVGFDLFQKVSVKRLKERKTLTHLIFLTLERPKTELYLNGQGASIDATWFSLVNN